jgi:hypothetical protein
MGEGYRWRRVLSKDSLAGDASAKQKGPGTNPALREEDQATIS